jgi:hypothetical protein
MTKPEITKKQDGDRSQALYIGPKAPVIRCRPRLIASGEKALVKR